MTSFPVIIIPSVIFMIPARIVIISPIFPRIIINFIPWHYPIWIFISIGIRPGVIIIIIVVIVISMDYGWIDYDIR
jgi:hypothetical protein